MKTNFLISVIMPVYQTEAYVGQSIESVLHQTIGFEDNIELILVNDATKDKAGIICEKYAKEYPENIVYIEHANNKGPSGAKNTGLKVARGTYINYMDSDDLWENDALEKLIDFMQQHERETDVVVGRLRHFDGREEWHILDWKFRDGQERVVDVFEQPEYIQLALGPVMFKTEIARSICHNEDIHYAEDALYFNRVVLNCGKYGIVPDAVYLYRARIGNDSAVQSSYKRIPWYTSTVGGVYKYFVQYSKKKYGEVIPYIQYLIMHEMQWRLANPMDCQEVDVEVYVESIRELLMNIEDRVILKSRFLWRERKLYALCLKRHIESDERQKRSFLKQYYPLTEGLHLQSVLVFNGKVHIRGFVRFPYRAEYVLLADMDGHVQEIRLSERGCGDVLSLGTCIAKSADFFFVMPFMSGQRLSFGLVSDGIYYLQKIKRFGNTRVDSDKVNVSEEWMECR